MTVLIYFCAATAPRATAGASEQKRYLLSFYSNIDNNLMIIISGTDSEEMKLYLHDIPPGNQ